MFNRSQVIPEAISISIIPIIPIPQLSSVLRVEVLSRSLWGASQQAAAHGCARPQTQRLHNVAWAADAAIGQDGNAIDAPEKSLRPQLPTKEGPSWEVATEPPWALSRGLLKPYCLEGYGGKDAWKWLHDHWSNVKHDFIVILLTQKPKGSPNLATDQTPGIPLSCGGLWSHSYGMKGFDSSPIQKSYPHYGRFVFDCHHRQTHSPPNMSETHLWVANTQVLHILPGKIQYSSWRSLVVCFRDLLFCEISMYFSDSICLQKLIILLLCL